VVPFSHGHRSAALSNVALVRDFLKAQNLEQLGRLEEAVDLYEQVVAAGFDSSGPYDRLIAVYSSEARHDEVVRVAEAALARVQTYADKQAWYERMRAEALKAGRRVPPAAPKGGP
jgi:tetratricopeptide (TPR) repeat protein